MKATKFKLFLVYNIDKDKPHFIELPTRFWEDNRYRLTPIIEKVEVKF